MLNKVMLIGNVAADPDIRCFENGNSVAKLRLGTTERFKDKEGKKREVTEWHNIEAWGTPASIIDQYVRKGDRLYVEGKIHYEEYTDKNNVTKYRTVIRLLNLSLLTPKHKQDTEPAQEQPSAHPSAQPQVAELAKQLDLTAVPEPPAVPMPPMADPDDLPF